MRRIVHRLRYHGYTHNHTSRGHTAEVDPLVEIDVELAIGGVAYGWERNSTLRQKAAILDLVASDSLEPKVSKAAVCVNGRFHRSDLFGSRKKPP